VPLRSPALDELDTLVEAAAEGSLTAAAASLGISRPAVAKRIKNLEALAACPLLERSGRGVRLTDAGAALIAGATRILDERDVLLSLLTEIRGDGPSPMAGLRELLRSAPAMSRAAQTAEGRLADTERVLELVLQHSSTGVVISDPISGEVHEVNDAFCRLLGRTRSEVLGERSTESGAWVDVEDRGSFIKELQRKGSVEGLCVRLARPDGTVRACRLTARFVSLAGSRKIVATVEDLTETTA
jgi:PAS domain S-box-containing protein